jgi:hypothetical protein
MYSPVAFGAGLEILVRDGHQTDLSFADAMREGGKDPIRPQKVLPALPHPPTHLLFPSTV